MRKMRKIGGKIEFVFFFVMTHEMISLFLLCRVCVGVNNEKGGKYQNKSCLACIHGGTKWKCGRNGKIILLLYIKSP